MAIFYYDTCGKLLEIFSEHCNLSMEQYEEISAQFIYLVSEYQDNEPEEEIRKRIGYMTAVFEFLYNTKELTEKELYELNEMLEEMEKQAEEIKAEVIRKAVTEGKIL